MAPPDASPSKPKPEAAKKKEKKAHNTPKKHSEKRKSPADDAMHVDEEHHDSKKAKPKASAKGDGAGKLKESPKGSTRSSSRKKK